MTFDEFETTLLEFLVGKLQYIDHCLRQGVCHAEEGSVFFPTLCNLTVLKDHYVAEFYGHQSRFKKPDVHKKKKLHTSVDEYLQQFPPSETGAVHVARRKVLWSRVALTDSPSPEKGLGRLGLREDIQGLSLLYFEKLGHGTMTVRPTGVSLFITDTLLLNWRHPHVRAKWIAFAVIVSKDLQAYDLRADFDILERPDTVTQQSAIENWILVPQHENIRKRTRAQFTSLYLSHINRETSIGRFLEQNPDILSAALGFRRAKHEVRLPWQGNCNLPDIVPDFFLERDDGYWDICDLKTALILEQLLTTGPVQRRKLKECVMEGVAQLLHYRRYFQEQANADYAHATHGIKIRNPRLILVIGHRDNLPKEELALGSEALHPDLQIIDYDTVATMYSMR